MHPTILLFAIFFGIYITEVVCSCINEKKAYEAVGCEEGPPVKHVVGPTSHAIHRSIGVHGCRDCSIKWKESVYTKKTRDGCFDVSFAELWTSGQLDSETDKSHHAY